MGFEGKSVRPGKWSRVIDLYDNGWYSAVWGTYDDWRPTAPRCLGVRYNGNIDNPRERGYPNQGGNPLWYVEPDFLTMEILKKLKAIVKSEFGEGHEYYENLEVAIKEFSAS